MKSTIPLPHALESVKLKVLIRIFQQEDLPGVTRLDRNVGGKDRTKYYERKLQHLSNKDQIRTSLVAEVDGNLVGFLMGYIYYGEYGIPENSASIDTILVHPEFRGRTIGEQLLRTFVSQMRALGVDRIYTLVDWSDTGLSGFFAKCGFRPSPKMNLELDVREASENSNLEMVSEYL
ncbi:MAG: GNAT family N-acetyltransferase [Acidobacteriia bacterium]|nr:GNAT family N-acetyltransferase [Terriglobia bacterium]